jgi:hypothetical protein
MVIFNYVYVPNCVNTHVYHLCMYVCKVYLVYEAVCVIFRVENLTEKKSRVSVFKYATTGLASWAGGQGKTRTGKERAKVRQGKGNARVGKDRQGRARAKQRQGMAKAKQRQGQSKGREGQARVRKGKSRAKQGQDKGGARTDKAKAKQDNEGIT